MFSQGLVLLALAFGIHAQVPDHLGQLVIQPGMNNGKCLTASSDSNGATVTLQACTGSSNQKWTFTGGAVKIYSNKCLDAKDGKNVNGVKLQVWDCWPGSANQKFSFSADKKLSWVDRNKCMDVTDGKATNGNVMQLWSCVNGNTNQVWNAGYLANTTPAQAEDCQSGTNQCGTGSSSSKNCQNLWINSASDFCVWGPPTANSVIEDAELDVVAYCTNTNRGSRTIPSGLLKNVKFTQTADYVQITGQGDLTKLNVKAGDSGSSLGARADAGKSVPVGALVFGDTFGAGLEYHEWVSFFSASEFCIRACTGNNASKNCNSTFDLKNCSWAAKAGAIQ